MNRCKSNGQHWKLLASPGRFLGVIALTLSVFVVGELTAAEKSSEAPAFHAYAIGISPFLDNSVKDEVYRGIVRLLVQDLPLNSSLAIYDAFELKTITKVELPDARVFKSPKTRANQFAPAIRDLKQFLAGGPGGTNIPAARLAGAIRLPQFLDFLAANPVSKDSKSSLLLIGSPLYEDGKEPGFSMVDGYFPSDGHLQATREESVFGLTGSAAESTLSLYWIYFGDPWVSELHKEKVTRFWTLYLERRATQLAAFTSDLASGLQGFQLGSEPPRAAGKNWAVDKSQNKIEMLRVTRKVEIADWLTRDALSERPLGPPKTMVGPMKIGIRWKENIDVDLYAFPRLGAETLFFQHPRSADGYYYKDHRSSPGKEYEFIEFEKPVDVREVEAFVNFYKGNCPEGPRGEVRIEFDGRIYGAPFSIPAEEGNLGRAGKSQQEYWTRIPVQEILKVARVVNRAG
jgi:hypothetical protein